ncbi:hypothetical protein ACYOEI_22790 [Singulisphaera rosea]
MIALMPLACLMESVLGRDSNPDRGIFTDSPKKSLTDYRFGNNIHRIGQKAWKEDFEPMNIASCITISEACKSLETYDALLRSLAATHGVQIVRRGRFSFIDVDDVEVLRPHVRAWKDRDRPSRRLAQA